ncbi:MAG: LUD domain-containing protein [Acidimicrobiaceae bacterium]|nr:LUD domain-containing protein [Acidimicrobiaceae bacterium]
MPSSKNEILQRIRQANTSQVTGVRTQSTLIRTTPMGDSEAKLDHDDLVKQFIERVEDYRSTMVEIGPDELASAFEKVLLGIEAREGFDTICVAPPLLHLFNKTVAGYKVTHPDRLTLKDYNSKVLGTLTGCAIGLAASGTIIFNSSDDEAPGISTLVPDHLFVVINESQIAQDIVGAITSFDLGRPLTMVSGPSATSDIELARVEGVHGPRNLTVFVVRQ